MKSDGDVVDMLAGTGGVIRNRFVADVVDWLVEPGGAVCRIGDLLATAAAAVAAAPLTMFGMNTCLPPTLILSLLYSVLNCSGKVRSSFASPLLSM